MNVLTAFHIFLFACYFTILDGGGQRIVDVFDREWYFIGFNVIN